MKPCPVCGARAARSVNTRPKTFALLRCRRCSAAYADGAWGEDRTRTHYRDYYEASPVRYDALTERRYHGILAALESVTDIGRVLDVGCGAGHFLMVATRRGWQATGVELSESALRLLAGMKARHDVAFSVIAGDVTEAHLEPASFDAVTLFEVIEHLADPLALLREVHRLLRPGGVVYLTTPNFNGLPRHVLGGAWRVVSEEHRCLLTVAALRRSLATTGFRPLRVITKNVDVTEILRRWRRREMPRSARHAAAQDVRHAIEQSGPLRRLKTAVNFALRVSRLGETIEATALKPIPGAP